MTVRRTTDDQGALRRGALFAFLGAVAVALIGAAGPAPAQVPDEGRLAFLHREAEAAWTPLPEVVRAAIIGAEDPDFLDRPPDRSPITAQLARYFLPAMQEIERRVAVGVVSARLAALLPGDDILTWYGHQVFLGRGCTGFAAAAPAYFGRGLAELRLEEAALLAGLIVSPVRYDPVRLPDAARERRDEVIRRMQEAGLVGEAAAQAAMARDIVLADPPGLCAP